MNEDAKLKKINKEIKIFINEANFISIKCRNKLIKILGEEFSISLPIENFANLDVTLLSSGNIVMRDEEYKQDKALSFEEVLERYNRFKEKAEGLLKRKEINYYNMNDSKNLLNLFVVIVILLFAFSLFIYAIKSFFYGDYINCIWIIIFISSWLVPGVRDRFTQAFQFLKRKFKK